MPSVGGTPVKPIGRFVARLAALEETLRPGARIAVVGGGAGGTELALALARRYRDQVRIVLVCDAAEPLASAPLYARSVARTALVNSGVELACGVRAGDWVDGRLALSDGSFLEVATALWATGVTGPAFLAASGLACDAVGCVRVDATLRSVSHGSVFAAGDCAAIEGNPRPKAGVWAVRAGAPLAANLRRVARGRAVRRWRPQSDALAIVGLGGGRALAWRNGVAVSGRSSMALEGLDRSPLDADVPAADGADAERRPDALRRLRRQGRCRGAGGRTGQSASAARRRCTDRTRCAATMRR